LCSGLRFFIGPDGRIWQDVETIVAPLKRMTFHPDSNAITPMLVEQSGLDATSSKYRSDLESLRAQFHTFPDLAEFKSGDLLRLDPDLLADIEYADLSVSLLSGDCNTRPPLLIRRDLADMLRSLRSSSCPKLVVRGVGGGGKTVNIVAAGQEFRRAGYLVVFLKGKEFSSDAFASNPNLVANRWIIRFLKVPSTRFLLSQLRCSFSPDHSFLTLLNLGRRCVPCSFEVMVRFLEALQGIHQPGVLLCLDQYNALLPKKQVETNPLAAMYSGWNNYSLANGAVLYAYSSAVSVEKDAIDGNRAVELRLNNFDPSELDSVLRAWFRCGAITTPADMFDEYKRRVLQETSALPREVGLLCLKFNRWFEDPRDLNAYVHQAKGYYRARLQKMLSRDCIGQELLRESTLFAANLYIGAPVLSIPTSWQIAGLMSQDSSNCWHLPCPAAYPAFFSVFSEEVSATLGAPAIQALKFWLNDLGTRWRGLELAVVHRLRLANTPVVIPFVDVTHNAVSKRSGLFSGSVPKIPRLDPLVFSIDRVVTRDHIPPGPFPISPGDAVVLWRGAAVADVFVYSREERKIWIQVSESPYADHSTKLPDLFTTNAIPGLSVYRFFRKCIDADYKESDQEKLERDEFYVYITSCNQRMTAAHQEFRANRVANVRLIPLSSFAEFFGPDVAACFPV